MKRSKIARADRRSSYTSEIIKTPKSIILIRLFVLAILAVVASLVGWLTYVVIREYESNDFKTQFRAASDLITLTIKNKHDIKFSAVRLLSKLYGDRFAESVWPNVTLIEFENVCYHLRTEANCRGFTFMPLVTISNRKAWEQYAASHENLLHLNSNLMRNSSAFWPVTKGIFMLDSSGRYPSYDDISDEGSKFPYVKAPIWQIYPQTDKSVHGTMWNIHQPVTKLSLALDNCISSKNVVISDIISLPIDDTYRPSSYVFAPILTNKMNTSKDILGFVSVVFSWDDLLADILPDSINGVYVVMTTSSGLSITYTMDGDQVTYEGTGDFHESEFNDWRVSVHLQNPLQSDYNYTDIQYSFDMYPSLSMQNIFYTTRPLYSTIGVILLVLITAIFFIAYDYYITSLNGKLSQVVAINSAIVNQFFPSIIRDRIFKDANRSMEEEEVGGQSQDDAKEPEGDGGSGFNDGPRPSFRHMLSARKREFIMTPRFVTASAARFADYMKAKSKHGHGISSGHGHLYYDKHSNHCRKDYGHITKSIFDQYDNVTVAFADVAGFTKWSSSHQPNEVFTVLECMFAFFDHYANTRGVFKIETVGDWYVITSALIVR